MLIEPVWGKLQQITGLGSELDKTVKTYYKKGDKIMMNGQINVFDEDTVIIDKSSLWRGLEAVYSRDLRLGDLDKTTELPKVRYYLDLAHDLLQSGYPYAFVTAMARVATIIKPLQLKGGWLRRLNNTIRQETENVSIEPKKKSLWGSSKTNQ